MIVVKNKPLPCHACGGEDLRCAIMPVLRIECDCGCAGPSAENSRLAIDKWNNLPRREELECLYCNTKGTWEGGTMSGANIMYCERCNVLFCTDCARAKELPLDKDRVLCADCLAQESPCS